MVFDYIIKWTEIVNYIYALVVLHEKNVYVANVKLDFADFKKLLDFREKIKDEMLSIFREYKGRYGCRRITLELKNRDFKLGLCYE